MQPLITALSALDPVELLVKATVLLTAGAGLAWALRRRAASVRHLLWTTTFVLLLALPPALLLLPAWELPLLPAATTIENAATGAPRQASSATGGPELSGARPAAPAPSQTATMPASERQQAASEPSLALLLWAAGSGAVLLSLLIGGLRFAARVRGGRPIRDRDWRDATAELCAKLQIGGEVRLVESAATRTPMTGGWRRAVILLPVSARQWSPQRRDVVLTHELVHVRRRDALRQVLGGVALALYWFHPLSWVAARLSVVSREQACDETVLDLGARPSEYARHLFELAESASPVPTVLSLPLVQRSHIERRIMAILRPSRPHASPAATSVVVLSLVVLGIAAALALPVSRAAAAPAAEMPQAVPAVEVAAAPAAERTARSAAASALPAAASATSAAGSITCRMEGAHGSFRGTMDTHDGRVETSGWHNGDRTIQKYVGGLRLCMRLHGEVVMADDRRSVRAVGDGSWAVLESEDGALRRVVITESADGLEYAFSVDGRARPWDAAADQWYQQMLRVLDLYWQASAIRGQESSLRGRISSYKGHVSSLEGSISSHRGHVSSLKGEASSYRGQVSSLKGEISSLKGHVSSLKGQISSHRGQIASLNGAMRATEDTATRARLAGEIERHEDHIRALEGEVADFGLTARVAEVERKLRDYDVEGKSSDVSRRIADYDLEAKVQAVEREIADYDLEGRVAAVEREIVELDADRRAAEIERRAEEELAELRRLIRSS